MEITFIDAWQKVGIRVDNVPVAVWFPDMGNGPPAIYWLSDFEALTESEKWDVHFACKERLSGYSQCDNRLFQLREL